MAAKTPTAKPKPPLPWKTKFLLSACGFLNTASIRTDGTVNRRLVSLYDLKASPNPTPIRGVSTSDHTVDPARNLRIRLFSPTRSDPLQPLPLMLYIHGGGFVFNSAFSRPFDSLCRRFSRQIPAYVASVEYRLAPEHRFPAPYDDGLDVLRWLDGNDLIPDLSTVFIAGDSAGGNIAHHVARRAGKEKFKRAKVAGLVAIQPFFGGEEDTESEKRLEGVPFGSREQFKWMWRAFLPDGSGLDHEAANVFGPGSGSGSEDWSDFPATMVIRGGWDTLRDRQMWYYEGLKGAGVKVCLAEYPNATHGFYAFPELADAKKLIEDVGSFVQRYKIPH